MPQISFDPFWDNKAGGGVRCSSTGEAANQYHDPSKHYLEQNGRAVSSVLPARYGLRGVVIPRATAFGGSRGFDPHKPRLINIDPDIKGQSCVVDLSLLNEDNVSKAFYEATQNPMTQDNLQLLAAQTFHNLAVGYEPVGMERDPRPLVEDRRGPFGDFGAYVVPKAGLSGGQLSPQYQPLQEMEQAAPMSPSISPRQTPMPNKEVLNKLARQRSMRIAQESTNPQPQIVHQVDSDGNEIAPPIIIPPQAGVSEQSYRGPMGPTPSTFVDQTPLERLPPPQTFTPIQVGRAAQTPQAINPPTTNVTFETKGWGQLEAPYHNVIKNGVLLVLAYDTRFKGGMKYFPPDTGEQLMAVKIEGANKVYYVHSTNSRFEHSGFEYCVLAIDSEETIPM